MSPSRHRGARRTPFRGRVGKLVVPAALATVVTGLVVGVGLNATGSKDTHVAVSPRNAVMRVTVPSLEDRDVAPSRTARRVTLEPEPVDREFATADLNIWTKASDRSKRLGLVQSGTKVAVTGQVVKGWAEVMLKGKVRYVNAEYLSDAKPKIRAEGSAGPAATGISLAPCPDGSSTEAGLVSDAVRLYRAVCAAFPALSSYGGWDGHGEHSSGRAIDFMTSDSRLGQAVADWIRAHGAELNVYDVIWAQHIWTPVRAAEGWRSMSDRGSATANHFDHVHASVN